MIFYAYFFCCLSQNNYLCTLIFSLLQNMQSHPTWVRGLKQTEKPATIKSEFVAPYVGAWIETKMVETMGLIPKSHPTWVRGLKHTSWQALAGSQVAPYVGAWIETGCLPSGCANSRVAPYVGTWIETSHIFGE